MWVRQNSNLTPSPEFCLSWSSQCIVWTCKASHIFPPSLPVHFHSPPFPVPHPEREQVVQASFCFPATEVLVVHQVIECAAVCQKVCFDLLLGCVVVCGECGFFYRVLCYLLLLFSLFVLLCFHFLNVFHNTPTPTPTPTPTSPGVLRPR